MERTSDNHATSPRYLTRYPQRGRVVGRDVNECDRSSGVRAVRCDPERERDRAQRTHSQMEPMKSTSEPQQCGYITRRVYSL